MISNKLTIIIWFLQYPSPSHMRDILNFIKPDSVEWKTKKEKAMNAAVTKTLEAITLYFGNSHENKYTDKGVKDFFQVLTKNQVFDAGFYDLDCRKVKYFCPCCRHMIKIRELNNVNNLLGNDNCDKNKRMKPFHTPNALMKHLKSKIETKNAFFHLGIETYLIDLYGDFWSSLPHNVIGHKGLQYNVGNSKYKQAKECETRL